MKGPFTYLPPSHECDCKNKHLLEHGKVCNICMGTIKSPYAVLENLLPQSTFDDKYFEELEAWYWGDNDHSLAV